MEVGYKVVLSMYSLPDSRYVSALNSDSHSRVEYGFYWASPKEDCGPLAVFETADQAFNFAATVLIGERFRILECAYIPEDREPYLYTQYGRMRLLNACPPGTKLARAVHLLRGVYDYHDAHKREYQGSDQGL